MELIVKRCMGYQALDHAAMQLGVAASGQPLCLLQWPALLWLHVHAAGCDKVGSESWSPIVSQPHLACGAGSSPWLQSGFSRHDATGSRPQGLARLWPTGAGPQGLAWLPLTGARPKHPAGLRPTGCWPACLAWLRYCSVSAVAKALSAKTSLIKALSALASVTKALSTLPTVTKALSACPSVAKALVACPRQVLQLLPESIHLRAQLLHQQVVPLILGDVDLHLQLRQLAVQALLPVDACLALVPAHPGAQIHDRMLGSGLYGVPQAGGPAAECRWPVLDNFEAQLPQQLIWHTCAVPLDRSEHGLSCPCMASEPQMLAFVSAWCEGGSELLEARNEHEASCEAEWPSIF